jgi:U3 small nucleolar RNA-associated protein 6
MSDFAMVRRIHFIFERAVRKFKTDLGLWTAWLEFCRNSNSNRRLGRVVARALHIHPTGVLVSYWSVDPAAVWYRC